MYTYQPSSSLFQAAIIYGALDHCLYAAALNSRRESGIFYLPQVNTPLSYVTVRDRPRLTIELPSIIKFEFLHLPPDK